MFGDTTSKRTVKWRRMECCGGARRGTNSYGGSRICTEGYGRQGGVRKVKGVPQGHGRHTGTPRESTTTGRR